LPPLRQILDQPPGRAVAAVAIAGLCLIWGTTWSVIHVGLRGIPPLSGVAMRFALASLLLVLLARAIGVPLRGSRIERRLWLVHGLCAFCISYGVTYWSQQWVPSGLASLLFATFPLFLAGFAHFALPGERLGGPSTLGMLAGFAGVAVIFSQDFELLGGPRVLLASAVMLVAPLSSALGNVTVKRWGEGIHPISLNAIAMGIAAGVMGAGALALERDEQLVFDAASIGALLYLAIAGSAVTFTVYFWLLRHMPATRLSLIAYMIPVVAVVVGWALFDEPVTARSIAGGALVLVGVALAGRRLRAEETPGREVEGPS
jgi:drug/metabolite transporter (DMT)-like permease